MQRSNAIDVLRVLAVFLVLGRHMIPLASDGSTILHHFAHTFTSLWNRGGWVGVDLFFVLSGFLVSGSLFREHQKYSGISGKSFLIRRGLKIYPAFWILIGLTAVVSLLCHRFHLEALLSELLFIQNYGPALWNHTWSLAVEEHFYILLLLFLAILSRRTSPNPFRLVPLVFVILAALSLGLRLATLYWTFYDPKIYLFPSHLRMDSLFCGVVVSYYYHYHSTRFLDFAQRYRVPAMLLGTVAFTPAFVFPLETSRFISTIGLPPTLVRIRIQSIFGTCRLLYCPFQRPNISSVSTGSTTGVGASISHYILSEHSLWAS